MVVPNFLDWPPLSLDLTVCDFFLWGNLEEKVYSHSLNNDEELKRAIEENLLQILPILFSNAFDSFVIHCYQSAAVICFQFE